MINTTTFVPDAAQAVALSTWHGGDNIRNMMMQLHIETAELAQLYHKAAFKPGHLIDPARLIDEQGDAFYYLLIITASYGSTVENIRQSHPYGGSGFVAHAADEAKKHDHFYHLAQMARSAANLWYIVENVYSSTNGIFTWGDIYPIEDLRRWLLYFEAYLQLTDTPLAEVVAWNQRKLAGGDNHGWKPGGKNDR